MSWDSSLPANTTKIRDYPTILTNNFTAVEQGNTSLRQWQVNFIDRDTVPGAPPPASNPTRLNDTMYIFSKTDSSANTEMFIMDDQNPANVIQLTTVGSLGNSSTPMTTSALTIGSTSFSNNQNNFVWAYGTIPAGGGAVTGGQGLGTATISTVGSDSDVYTVPLTRTPSNTNYIVIATATSVGSSQGNNRIVNLLTGSKTTGQFRLRMQRNGSSTNLTDVAINILVCGGF